MYHLARVNDFETLNSTIKEIWLKCVLEQIMSFLWSSFDYLYQGCDVFTNLSWLMLALYTF